MGTVPETRLRSAARKHKTKSHTASKAADAAALGIFGIFGEYWPASDRVIQPVGHFLAPRSSGAVLYTIKARRFLLFRASCPTPTPATPGSLRERAEGIEQELGVRGDGVT